MQKERIQIGNIPAVIWGEKQNKVFIAVHGNMSHKEDTVIQMLAELVTKRGYQVLSFDLPEHGERKEDKSYLCKVQNCVSDLKRVVECAKNNYKERLSVLKYLSKKAWTSTSVKFSSSISFTRLSLD